MWFVGENMAIIKNCLIVFAIGDAIGVPIEFKSRKDLMRSPVTAMKGYWSYGVPEGTWSNDTSMALATMDSIIECNGIDYNNIADKFCEWFNNAKYIATNEVFDIGVTTKYSLMRYWNIRNNVTECGGKKYNENVNGSLMRMLPIVLFSYYKKLSEKQIYEIVKKTSSITHAHEISILGCYILENNSRIESYNKIKSINYSKSFDRKL